MQQASIRFVLSFVLLALSVAAPSGYASVPTDETVRRAVDAAILPLMAKDGIPGMAVGVTVGGKSYVYQYGLASKSPRQPVTPSTLFEIGSVSKTFTATLASLAVVEHRMSLSDRVSAFFPELDGVPFGAVRLVNLGTHTPGGLALQVPDNVTNDEQLLRYLRAWKPTCAIGTCRTYSNIGIGLLGLITAKSMNAPFESLMDQRIFRALSLSNTFLTIPAGRTADYAQGYTSDGAPIRMSGGELDKEAYGVRTTAGDLLRFIEANMGLIYVSNDVKRAMTQARTGYFRAGPFVQDLIWEQYPYPVSLATLQRGNSPDVIFNSMPAKALIPAQAPEDGVWVNKTGSTNGFSAYVAFVPAKHLGIVILANRSYPIEDRVAAEYRVLSSL